jgi:hypothetical protein
VIFYQRVVEKLISQNAGKSGSCMYKKSGMKFTQNTLDKIERIVEEGGYVIRYERGTFQSGYCILQSKKVVVLNKFLQTEGRINTLIDLLPLLHISIDQLTHDSQKLYDELMSVGVQA